MDAKITKERLSRMLSYDWLKIVGIALAAIIFWTLVFTTSRTRITPAQQFTAINYFGNAGTIETSFSSTLSKAFQDGVFSYEVIELTEVDVGGNEELGATLMQTRVSTNEGDVVFVPNIMDEESVYTVQGEKYTETYLQGLARNYLYALTNLDREDPEGYFKRLERFLEKYYTDGYKNEALDEEKIERDFLARIQKNKDKRFKKEAQIQQGIQDEIARVKKYRDALIEFDGYLQSGLVEMTPIVVMNLETGKPAFEGVVSINICSDPVKMPNITKVAGYWEEVKNDAGEVQAPKLVAKDMNVAILEFEKTEESFEFESLLYINYIIRIGKTA